MKLFDFFTKKELKLSDYYFNAASEVYVKKLAIEIAITYIANALSNSEFKTFLNNKFKKGDNYYLFNVEPNPNQNQVQFISKLIHNLVYDTEALVIQNNGYFYVADSFSKTERGLIPKSFHSITIDNIMFNKTFYANEVFYFTLTSPEINNVIDGFYESYGKLIGQVIKSYRKNMSVRGKLRISTAWAKTREKIDSLENVVKQKFSSYFENDNAVLTQEDGFDFTESTNRSNANSDEVNKLIDEVFDIVAMAFHIPKGMMKGELADVKEQTKNFLTFAIDPFANNIEKEINRKLYKKNAYLNGSYLKIDTTRVSHVDIFESAANIDKLFSNGWSANEIRDKLGDEKIDESWADEHYVTKNYENKSVLKGGDGKNE